MKSTLLMDEKDLEENILIIEKQIELFNKFLLTDFPNLHHTTNNEENFKSNSFKIISSTA